MDTLTTFAQIFLTNFQFWNQLNLLKFKKVIPELHWMKAALDFKLKPIEISKSIWEMFKFKSILPFIVSKVKTV